MKNFHPLLPPHFMSSYISPFAMDALFMILSKANPSHLWVSCIRRHDSSHHPFSFLHFKEFLHSSFPSASIYTKIPPFKNVSLEGICLLVASQFILVSITIKNSFKEKFMQESNWLHTIFSHFLINTLHLTPLSTKDYWWPQHCPIQCSFHSRLAEFDRIGHTFLDIFSSLCF